MTDHPRRVLILMSDTGGGHRSAAEAIAAALDREFPGRYTTTLFDVFKQAAFFPFNHIPSLYLPLTTYAEFAWHLLFLTTDNRLTAWLSQFLFNFLMGYKLRRYLRQLSPDLVVSTHPIFTTFARRALRAVGSHAPFIVVVTDLFDAHVLWFDKDADGITVPTEGARQMGLRFGASAEKMHVLGEPVSLKFIVNGLDQTHARAKLGLAPDTKTILLVGGGEGMGPLFQIAQTIDQMHLPAQLVIIAGRNDPLRHKLLTAHWQMPVHVQGFVTNMPEWMRASDVIITKAGPGTISEALACHLPILLSGFLPGQETGNVTFVEQSGVGVLRRNPQALARTLSEWLTPGNETLARFSARAKELARPQAAIDIAQLLDEVLTSRRSKP